VNVLALNAGSGSLRCELFDRSDGNGPAAETLRKAHAFDRVQGRATVEAAERAVTDCLRMGIDAIGCASVSPSR
jgi:hypothetical protein